MNRFFATLLIAMVAIDTTQSFTMSMVPLLARLGPFRNHYVSPSPVAEDPSLEADERSNVVATPKTSVIKPATKKFKFEYTDAHMISDCKSEIMEYVYAKSLDRGFA
ncbi:hypothetical protein ACHAWC_009413 [Mediolabrus comicus]